MPKKITKRSIKKKSTKKKKSPGIPKNILSLLEEWGISYEVVPHRKVYTAYDLAQTLGEQMEKVAKTVLLSVDLPQVKAKGKTYVLVVPASYRVDLGKVKKGLKAKKVEFAPERIMKKLGIEPGTMPPFGSVYDLEVLIDKTMLGTKEAIVRAGSLTESLRIRMKDLVKFEKAIVGQFGKKSPTKKRSAKAKAAKKTTKKGRTKKKTARKPARRK